MTAKLVLLTSLLLYIICESGSKRAKASNPPVSFIENKHHLIYDLSRPIKVWSLPGSLKEISGNAWANENHLLVIEDLHRRLYLVRLEKEGMIEKAIPFLQQGDKKFDLEDIALAGNTAYALWSHGLIYKIDNWNSKPSVYRLETGLSRKNNTEGLCFDPVSHNLLIACKNRSGDENEKKSTRAVYMFVLSSGKLRKIPFLLMHKKDFKERENDASGFFPSAIAVHPQTHDLYILSTKGTKAMAIYSYEGKLKSFQLINKEQMPQPEGICFSPEGKLYISTEGRHGEPAKIFEFIQ